MCLAIRSAARFMTAFSASKCSYPSGLSSRFRGGFGTGIGIEKGQDFLADRACQTHPTRMPGLAQSVQILK